MTEEELETLDIDDIIWVPLAIARIRRDSNANFPVVLDLGSHVVYEYTAELRPSRFELLDCRLERKNKEREND